MRRTAIDWCDSTWNPVTGCLHGCAYCYARKMAIRFGSGITTGHNHTHMLGKPVHLKSGTVCPYPFNFDPTLHLYKLGEPCHWRKPRTVFVCSMADLFGDWVPDEWIRLVFNAAEAAPQHRYIYLTKYPERIRRIESAGWLPEHANWWWGATVTDKSSKALYGLGLRHTLVSVEPLMERLDTELGTFGGAEWIIIGAETGNRTGRIEPEREWVENICDAASLTDAAVFMKESLRDLMGSSFRQEYPWRRNK